ncbi:MAG: protein-disulfide reductase DsbD family protein [Paludibacteraceae bacterium]
MKKYILFFLLMMTAVQAVGQIVTPVRWSGETVGDSVRLTATVESGWHMTLIAIDGITIGQEYADGCVLMLAKADTVSVTYNACDETMCTAPETWQYIQDIALADSEMEAAEEASAADESLWWIFLMGFLGGLLAIFTPCVWPIIPMTVSFFLKRSDHGVKNAVLYGVSIIVIYVGLGLLITAIFGASALNAISTNAVVNICFFALLVVFALSFFGLFEITLPSSWSTKLDSKARSTGGFVSILLMAFTLVIVSFSCTGPIIGTLLVEAAGHSYLAPAVGMLGFAVALALPFSLFAMFPQWMKQMPRSGGWMQSFKVVLAFLELALSLKFLSVADLAYGWGILPRWLFLAVWIGCFLGIGIYLLVGIARVSPTRKAIRAVVIVLSWAFAFYLLPGLWGAPVKAVSAFAPPMKIEGREVFNDYDEGMAYARQERKPVLLDFSGYGCVNCRKMEAYVLDNEAVKQRLQQYVLIELYVDDKRDGIGEKNSAIQREQFGSNAQPFYIQLDADGKRISDPYAFSTDVEDFLKWLVY